MMNLYKNQTQKQTQLSFWHSTLPEQYYHIDIQFL